MASGVGGSTGAGVGGSTGAGGSTTAGLSANAGVGGSSMMGPGGNSAVAGAGVMWASGGTKSMRGGYPDPFMSGMSGTPCMVYPSQTLGPCYAQSPMLREDISDGMTGLPIRLSLLLVRANGCMPVPNATVDIWAAGSNGIYSAYAMGTICNPGTQNVMSMMYGRGVQTTDANGRVNFNTVFPGWYTGRTLHIHFTVRVDGRESKTSQLYFEDALTDEILAQGEYAARGKRDTTNATDMIFRSGSATAQSVVMSTAKRPDGVLHAWKVLAIM